MIIQALLWSFRLITWNELDSVQVVIGEHDLTAKEDPWRKVMKIADYRLHQNYVGSVPLYNDIAIIKTSEEVELEREGRQSLPGLASSADYYPTSLPSCGRSLGD